MFPIITNPGQSEIFSKKEKSIISGSTSHHAKFFLVLCGMPPEIIPILFREKKNNRNVHLNTSVVQRLFYTDIYRIQLDRLLRHCLT